MLRARRTPPRSRGDEAGARSSAVSRLRVPRRAAAVAAAFAIALLALAALGVGPVVRSRIAAEATRRGLDVSVSSVRPGFFSVGLLGVRVRADGIAGVEAYLDAVDVQLSGTLGLREIVAKGGRITVDGEPEEIADRLRAFRQSRAGAGSDGAGHRTPVAAHDLSFSWKTPSGLDVAGSGLGIVRERGTTRVSCATMAGRYRELSVELAGGEVELGGEGAPRRISAASLVVGYEVARAAAAEPKPGASNVEPAPPPLPSVTRDKKVRAATKEVPKPQEAASDEPVLSLPDLHAARARIAGIATAFGTKVPDGTTIDIRGLSAKLDVGGEPVAFGPGPLSVQRQGDRIRLGFSSEKAAQGGTPLSIDAELPLGQGDVVGRLSGGPVSLALLGVREGTKGLFDVGRGTIRGKGQLVLAAAGDALTFDGNIALRGISVKQPRLAPEPVRGIDFAIAARGLLDDSGRLRVDDAQLEMGALHVSTHGTVEETKDHFGLSLQVEVAPAACQALLESAPQGLLQVVRSARMSGTFAASARVAFDSRSIDKLGLDYRIEDTCKMLEVPADLSPDRFRTSFTYTTYHPDGAAFETRTGPDTDDWTRLDDISPYMVAALLTTEDGAFYRHHGFNHAAIRNSVAANLKARRFIRGASTITMQLAKNLFLSRNKTLSRKIEEVILTDYLEQVLRKDDILELYLNVVEFGPDVYGITRAAEHYFGRKPDELTVPECFFLASLLPSPVRYGKLRDKGEVAEGWNKHLRGLIEIAAKNGKITAAELAEAQGQQVVFWRPGTPKPEPRQPQTKLRRDPYEDDASWRPLD